MTKKCMGGSELVGAVNTKKTSLKAFRASKSDLQHVKSLRRRQWYLMAQGHQISLGSETSKTVNQLDVRPLQANR